MTQPEMAELLRVPLITLAKWEAESLDLKATKLLALMSGQNGSPAGKPSGSPPARKRSRPAAHRT